MKKISTHPLGGVVSCGIPFATKIKSIALFAITFVLLSVNNLNAQAPANDECPGALPVACDAPVTGSTVGAPTVTTPSCGGTSVFGSAGGLWYSYTAPSDGNYKVTTCSDLTDFDTQVRVYSGDCDALVCVSDNDDNGGVDPLCFHSGLHSMAFANLTAGEQYYILVFGFNNSEGNFELSVVCDDPCLSDMEAPTVTCTEASFDFDACPDQYGANTPNGTWISVPASGVINSVAGGGTFNIIVDLNNCVSDNNTAFADLEYSLHSSYSENTVFGCSNTIVNELMFRDECGNVSTDRVVVKFNISDPGSLPTIDCPASLAIDCNASTDPLNTGTATGDTDCGSVVISFADVVAPATDCPAIEIITRTWTATNACGLSTSCDQIITIQDTTPPVLVPTATPLVQHECTTYDVLSLMSYAQGTLSPADSTAYADYVLDLYLATLSPISNTDDCGTASIVFDHLDIEYPENPLFGGGTITEADCPVRARFILHYYSTDGCNDTPMETVTIEVKDTTAPIITSFPADVEVQCSELSSVDEAGVLAYFPIDSFFDLFEFEDDCVPYADIPLDILEGLGLISVEVTSDFTVDCPVVGTCSKTLTVSDGCYEVSHTYTITIIDTEAPVFEAFEDTVTVQCLEDVPPILDLTAEDCGDIITATSFESNTGELKSSYVLTEALGGIADWSLWMPVLADSGLVSSANFVWDANGGTFDCFADSTGHLYGTVVNDLNPSEIFVIDFWFEGNYNWTDWSAAGHLAKDPLNTCPDDHINWNFWKLVDGISNVQGAGDLLGSDLSLYHMPADYTFGFQVGLGANTKNCNFGMSGWFTYTGLLTYQGTTTSVVGNGDINVDADCENFNPMDCVNNTEFKYLYMAQDDCLNTARTCQVIIVNDTTPPTFTYVGADATVMCDLWPMPVDSAMAVDNCIGDVTLVMVQDSIPGTCPHEFTITRTWRATDICDNFADSTQTIQVVDTEAPVMSGLPAATGTDISEIEVQCDDIPEAPVVTATDNCSLPENITIAFSETSTLDADGPCDYYITRTWSATDECTNTSVTFTQIIHVIDTVGPVFDPFDIQVYVECDEVMDYTVTAQDCNFEGITYTQILGSWGCSLGSYTRTYTATDSCGNSTTAVQYINIIDTTAPEILGVPADTDMECSDMPTPVGGLYFDLGGVTAIDNCQGAMTVTYAEDSMPGACIDAFVLTRSWSAIDSCGNADTLYQVINVLDTTDPEWDFFPENSTYECTDVVPNEMATATDNCDLDVMVTMVADTTFGDCAGYYEITRTFTAVDNCENDIVQAQTIYIIDTTGPDFVTVPADETYECTDIIPEDLATATDECSGPPIITFEDVVTGNSCETLITRTFTATDSCGNASTAIQLITVLDTTPPVFDPYAPELDMPCDDINTTITVTATDACPSPTITSFDDLQVSGGCAGTIIRTYYATDSCGNVDSIQQIIHLLDDVAPTFIDFPVNAEYQCLTDVPTPAMLSGEDNCDEEPVVVFVGDVTEGTCPTTITRTWRVTDHCDNFTEMSQTIVVDDTIDPEFTLVPEDETLDCIDDVPTTTTAEASDNCTTPVITFEDVEAGNDCLRTVTRTFTATDACGNTATATQVFTFVDDTPPTFTSVPADDEYECSDVIPEDLATATDDCNTVLVTFEDVTSGDPCIATIITRTFTATDACGNEATAIQTITLVDTTPPVLSVDPEDIEVTCDDEIPAPIDGITAMDNCDDDVEVIMTETVIGRAPTPGSDSDCALSTGDNIPNVDWSLVLYDFPNGDSFYATTEAYFVEFPDGSAHLYGHVASTTTAGGWDIDVWFEDKMDWAEWSAILPARSYKDDYDVVGLNYVDWSYYIMSAGATLSGTGDYLGSTLNLTHAPSNYYYGYQVGIGANNVNLEFGNGGWFEATGTIVINGGTPIVLDWPNRISGDFAFDADCCLEYQIVRTYTATDCSGNNSSVSYTVDVIESDAEIEGCTDSEACNYNPAADTDDGSCISAGCTDSSANNYDSTAGCDDGSCTYDALPGCTDSGACNYDPAASADDGSCEFGDWYIPEPGTFAPITLSCEPLAGYFYADQDCAQFVVDNNPFCVDNEWDSLCQDDYDACLGIFPGCMDTTACNYDSSATTDDGSCTYPGCMDTAAVNYDSTAGCDDGSCAYSSGCMDTTACNYDSQADTDDGSCTYPTCMDVTAINFDSTGGCDDISLCIYPPTNDLCADAIEIMCGDSLEGTTIGASNDDQPAECGTTLGAPGVWYSFTGDGSEVTFDLCSDVTDYDTKISVYSGTCDALVCVDGNDDSCGLQSSTTAILADGEEYLVYVYGFGSAVGNFELVATCVAVVPGCVDTTACNYDSAATTDDGSCTYPGCTDTTADNYDSTAGCADDTLCVYSAGCMDTTACNYDSTADSDDGSCTYPGCLDTTALNYDSTAGCDDNTLCTYPLDLCNETVTPISCGDLINGSTLGSTNTPPETCGTTATASGAWYSITGTGEQATFSLCGSLYDTKLHLFSGTCDAYVCVGGNDDACGLQSELTADLEDGVDYFLYVSGFGSATGDFVLNVTCIGDIVEGCTDATACNYDALANTDDGSCIAAGCFDPAAVNFDPGAACENNTLCIYAPENDLCADALEVFCGETISGTTVGATTDGNPTDFCGTTPSSGGVWYTFVATGPETTFSTCDAANYDTKINVYSGDCGALVCEGGNDDGPGCTGFSSELTLATTNGVTYTILVNGFNGGTGDFDLTIDCGPAAPQLQLEVTALLGGPLNPETLQMNDLIRTEASFPLTDPYTELGYEHVNAEEAKTKAEVLAVDGFDAIVDWVVIELRNGDNPEERLATQAALIQKDGDIVSTDGVSPVMFDNPGGSVLVVIRHRNHLGVCNLEPTVLTGGNETITLDFTDPNLPVMGGVLAMGVEGDVRILFAGDANSDGSVNPFDKNAHWRVENGSVYDYFDSKSDFNLDGAINPFDKNSKWRLNNGRSEQVD